MRTGDYVRAINDKPTREMSVWEGMRALRGAPGSKVTLTIIRGNAADPHVVELTREDAPAAEVTGRIAAPGVGYVRIAADRTRTAAQVEVGRSPICTKAGAAKLIVDVRRTSERPLDDGLGARAAVRRPRARSRSARRRASAKEAIAAGAGDGAITRRCPS